MYYCLQSRIPVAEIGISFCNDVSNDFSWWNSEYRCKSWRGVGSRSGRGSRANIISRNKGWNSGELCVCVFIIIHFTTTVCTHILCLFTVPVCMTIFHIIEWLLITCLHVIGDRLINCALFLDFSWLYSCI